ncbi:MAG: hypothetical protein M0014_02210 [Actinomycetota bacterium]|nr:hypothetical protein [Actinomycetota bacterium]
MTMLLVTLPLMMLGLAVAVIPLVLAISKELGRDAKAPSTLVAYGRERAEPLLADEQLAA